MTIFHLSVKTISRSKGRSATAAAAYRSGSRIYDKRTGLTFNYRKKEGVNYTKIFGWAGSRQTLWNKVELTEKRKNSCVAREIEFALPVNISTKKRVDIAEEFCQQVAKRYQIAGEMAIHHIHSNNPHCHFLMTTRKIRDGNFTEKTRILDCKQSGPIEVEALRHAWANAVNAALEESNLHERVEHRSYKRQGIAKIPSKHLGPTASALEKKSPGSSEKNEKIALLRTLKKQLSKIQKEIRKLKTTLLNKACTMQKTSSQLTNK